LIELEGRGLWEVHGPPFSGEWLVGLDSKPMLLLCHERLDLGTGSVCALDLCVEGTKGRVVLDRLIGSDTDGHYSWANYGHRGHREQVDQFLARLGFGRVLSDAMRMDPGDVVGERPELKAGMTRSESTVQIVVYIEETSLNTKPLEVLGVLGLNYVSSTPLFHWAFSILGEAWLKHLIKAPTYLGYGDLADLEGLEKMRLALTCMGFEPKLIDTAFGKHLGSRVQQPSGA